MNGIIKNNIGKAAGVAIFAVTICTIAVFNTNGKAAAKDDNQVTAAAGVETTQAGTAGPLPANVEAANLRFEQTDVEQLQSLASYESVALKANITGDVQEIRTDLAYYGYPAITVQKGIPVRFIINVDQKNLNACNNEIIIPDLNISKKLKPGENVIEFTPEEAAVIPYSCWMGMINSTIAVVDDIDNIDSADIQGRINALPQVGGCCGVRN